jgi:hypothetical protein
MGWSKFLNYSTDPNEEAMEKICKDCKWFEGRETNCLHPALRKPNLVRGGYEGVNPYVQRLKDYPCGPEGKLWEARDD